MKLKHFENSWRGISFTSLGISCNRNRVADSLFYAAFYKKLAQYRDDPTQLSWYKDKIYTSHWIEKNFLNFLNKDSKLLSIGVGQGIIEDFWLKSGYNVTLNDCADVALDAIREKFPNVKLNIGQADNLKLNEKYNFIAMLGVDYALDDDELQKCFKSLAESLEPDGIIISQTLNILSLKQLFKELIKRYILFRYNQNGYIFWGWWREPAHVVKLANKSGLKCVQQYIYDGQFYHIRRFKYLPSITHNNIVFVFRVSMTRVNNIK